MNDVLDLWRAASAAGPARIALTGGDNNLTYHQLDVATDAVAERLAAAGAGPGTRVALDLTAPVDAVVALLGTLKTGASFAVVDGDLPEAARAERYRSVDIAFTVGRYAQPPNPDSASSLDLSSQLDSWRAAKSAPDSGARGRQRFSPTSDAYVMFTSGSTGDPKAIAIERGPLAGFARALADRVGLRPDDCWLQLASPGFDVFIEEVFPVLAAGAALGCRPDFTPLDPQELHAKMQELGVTVVELSTQYWREYARWLRVHDLQAPATLRSVLVGGERMDAADYRYWQRSQRCRLLHVYGLTECTVTSTVYDGLLPQTATEVPIGRPLDGVTVTVREESGELVPAGQMGQIHIGGPSVARGYLNDPAETACKFIGDPADHEAGIRYATGDLGRILPDGNLEFLGRVDDQLKIRGHRLEPRSVERLLQCDPAVAQAIVLLDPRDPTVLCGFLVPTDPADLPVDGRLRPVREALRISLIALLSESLPDWAIPTRFAWVAELPKNAHGKIDRRALSIVTDIGVPRHREFAATSGRAIQPADAAGPGTELSDVLEHFRNVLDDPDLGPDEDFFAHGGQSLLAMRLVTELRTSFPGTAGLRVTTIFDHPTANGLASWLTANADAAGIGSS